MTTSTEDRIDDAARSDAAAWPLADDGYHGLPRAALSAGRLAATLLALLAVVALTAPLFALTVVLAEAWWLFAVAWIGAAVLLSTLGWWYAGVRWRHTGWRLDGDGLRIRRGAWWRSETQVPRSRVQHVDLNHGPLDRRFGLASLKVHTAGTRLSSVQLGGLAHADAERLRDALVADADAQAGGAAPPAQDPAGTGVDG